MALVGNYKTPGENQLERMFQESDYILKWVERGHLLWSLVTSYILPACGTLRFHEARMIAECDQNP